MSKNFYQESKSRCNNHRKKIIEISQTVNALHLGGALSSIEVVDFIYYRLLKLYKDSKFIMSKGHGSIAQYIALNSLGTISDEELSKYCTSEGKLGCHPDIGNPGIHASTGSLGHGLGLCVGIAQAYKIKSKNQKIITLISDGELQEGSTWESLMMAANLNLDNLIIFVDHNGSQSFGETKITHPAFYPIIDKLVSFNCDLESVNGHEAAQMDEAFNKLKDKTNKPKIIFCNTVKGKGVSYMENQPIWHYRSPNKEEYLQAVKELEEIK